VFGEYTERMNTTCGQNAGLLNVKERGTGTGHCVKQLTRAL